VCQSISAVALIDDNLNHVVSCAAGRPPVPTVLFGKYKWNERLSASVSELDRMSYDERLRVEGGQAGWWERDNLNELPVLVRRCAVWDGVVDVLKDLLDVESSVA
jgi:hypothetical protein